MLAQAEESRRQWISDSSPELRTPIAVLRAEIEALQDAVRTADEPTLARIHRSVMRMSKLVDDLRQTLDRDDGRPDLARVLVDYLLRDGFDASVEGDGARARSSSRSMLSNSSRNGWVSTVGATSAFFQADPLRRKLPRRPGFTDGDPSFPGGATGGVRYPG